MVGGLIITEVVVLDGWIMMVLDAAPECEIRLCPYRRPTRINHHWVVTLDDGLAALHADRYL